MLAPRAMAIALRPALRGDTSGIAEGMQQRRLPPVRGQASSAMIVVIGVMALFAGACSPQPDGAGSETPGRAEATPSTSAKPRQTEAPIPHEMSGPQNPTAWLSAPEALPSANIPPGDPSSDALPLPRGVYVLAGSACEDPANAAIRVFDGRGISGSATRDCCIRPIRIEGVRHAIEQSCVNTYDGSRSTERQWVEPRGDAFILTTQRGTATYRLCSRLRPEDFGAGG